MFTVVSNPQSNQLSVNQAVERARSGNVFLLAKRKTRVTGKATNYRIVFVGKRGGENQYQALNLAGHKVWNKEPMTLSRLLTKLLATNQFNVTGYATEGERATAANR